MPSLKDRLGLNPPQGGGEHRIWLHAVSLGEMRAATALVKLFDPRDFLITTATATGFEEAKKSFPSAEVRYLPLDFSWTMRRWLRSFRPSQLLFIEGDLWPNLLQEAKKAHVKTILVSGKISERSQKRLAYFPFLAKKLISTDLICVQNEEHRARFASLTNRPIHITGNLKLDIAAKPTQALPISKPAVTLACTHAPEELEILTHLKPHLRRFTLFLAPRHPERFTEVALLLQKLEIPFSLWNHPAASGVIFVNTMGQLHNCYASSNVAILAGSFSSRVGGHNVLEPCLYGCPVLFGPHMHAQNELAKLVMQAGAGRQVSQDCLSEALFEWLENPPKEKALALAAHCSGSAQRTYDLLSSRLI